MMRILFQLFLVAGVYTQAQAAIEAAELYIDERIEEIAKPAFNKFVVKRPDREYIGKMRTNLYNHFYKEICELPAGEGWYTATPVEKDLCVLAIREQVAKMTTCYYDYKLTRGLCAYGRSRYRLQAQNNPNRDFPSMIRSAAELECVKRLKKKAYAAICMDGVFRAQERARFGESSNPVYSMGLGHH